MWPGEEHPQETVGLPRGKRAMGNGTAGDGHG